MNDPIYEKVPVEDFPWPCARRDAHHPHYDASRSFQPGMKAASPNCPGVQAHPATMSGTLYRLKDAS